MIAFTYASSFAHVNSFIKSSIANELHGEVYTNLDSKYVIFPSHELQYVYMPES